jgi:SanA protein
VVTRWLPAVGSLGGVRLPAVRLKGLWPAGRWRRLLVAGAGLGALLGVFVGLVNVGIVLGTRDDVTSVERARPAQAAIVLGARAYPGGGMSPMLGDRVATAAELYRAGRVSKVIVSGDHGTWAYDEPGTMRDALVAQGVEPRDVFTDHAGFDTWATMRRAREVFGVRSAIVVSQGFHLPRALYLAHAAGLEAEGVPADLRPYGPSETSSRVREVVARVKAFGSATVNAPVVLGPAIPIDGDGRASWGPAGPPG